MRKMPTDVEKLDRISGSIDADGKGNAKVGNDLTIDGNLKFKSLVSGDNPEGVFNPSSGGTGGGGETLYNHFIYISYSGSGSDSGRIFFNYYTKSGTQFTLETLTTALAGKKVICSGYRFIARTRVVSYIEGKNGKLTISYYDTQGTSASNLLKDIGVDFTLVSDDVTAVN